MTIPELELGQDGVLRAYSKPSRDIAAQTESYFRNNASGLEVVQGQHALYLRQPRRTACKLCDAALAAAPAFVKHGVPYGFCPVCGHVNGLHQDTPEFVHAIYCADDGAGYAAHYVSPDPDAFRQRVANVYAPKAEFLMAVLRRQGETPERLRYADVGAGSGYFIAALDQIGVQSAIGIEASARQVAVANGHLGREALRTIPVDDTVEWLATTDAEVVSMIGVLEHLADMRSALAAITGNPRIRYLYLCVPLFSVAVLVEAAFPHVMPRVLCADHTHVFTQQSLGHMEAEFGLDPLGQWWFASDAVDLLRSVSVTLAGRPESQGLLPHATAMLSPLVDAFQSAVDRHHLSSDVHLVHRIQR